MERKKSDVREWLDAQYVKEPGLREEVAAMLTKMELEQGLVALREERGISQRQLAAVSGLKQPAIARLEAGGAKHAELRTVARYVAALGARLRFEIEIPPRRSGRILAFAKKKK
jgi:predicted XRE-type DNA-binding protein